MNIIKKQIKNCLMKNYERLHLSGPDCCNLFLNKLQFDMGRKTWKSKVVANRRGLRSELQNSI